MGKWCEDAEKDVMKMEDHSEAPASQRAWGHRKLRESQGVRAFSSVFKGSMGYKHADFKLPVSRTAADNAFLLF